MSRRRRSRRRSRVAPPPLPSFIRRRSTKWLIAAIATLTLAIVLGLLAQATDDSGGTSSAATALPTRTADASKTPEPTTDAVAPPDLLPDPLRLERAEVVDIVDGDTIDVRIDGREERVRYYGVDTTERGDDCFSEATGRNEQLAGDVVHLLPDARERDRFGRLLRYAFDDFGRSIEAQLIAEGLGHAWRDDGAYRDQLVELEAQAEGAGVGCLWE
jgi:micrococcal nuclease